MVFKPETDGFGFSMQEQLLKQYLESLAKRLERIESLLEKLTSGNSKAEENIRLLTHSLAGSGGAFGFPEISESAKAAELAEKPDLEGKLRELKAVIEKILAETSLEAGSASDDQNSVPTSGENKAQAAKEGKTPAEQQGKNGSEDSEKKVIKILVVDDDADIINLVKSALGELPKKLDISVAESAAKAQELFVTDIYDLIIMDLMLPDRDGRELISEIKIEFKLPSPLLVLSSVRNDTVRVECMSLGADKFLLKPFYPEDLLHEVKKLLGKKVAKKLSLVPLDGEAIEEEDGDEEEDDSPKVLSGFNVLVAEDDKMQGMLIQQKLSAEGATIDVAQNGREAMQLLRTKGYSLIILDVQMPVMDGFEVLQRLKDDLNLDTPVIMVTAMGDEDDIIKGYDLGATDYILNPFSEVQLIARVKSLLKSRKES